MMSEEEYLQSCAKRVQTDRIDRTVDHLLNWAGGTQRSVRLLLVFCIAQVIVDIALLFAVFSALVR